MRLALNTEDGRSPYMILKEEREMAKKAPKTSVRAVKTLGEYVDSKQGLRAMESLYRLITASWR